MFGRCFSVCQRNTEGVASVLYKLPEEASVCVEATNGRWFAGRQLKAEIWDGRTKYQVQLLSLSNKATLVAKKLWPH